ncbi:MAG: dihydroneopterin aldolase [Hyphomicrobiales bacterium]|nr:dihydroneopterin aldolase [Hyphomicrobiales bacterium]
MGGSTAKGAELPTWIAALASAALPLVIVPGGGPFAELVRVEQKRMGFSNEAAHAMAILAMDAFGCVIMDGQARMAPARSVDEVERVLGEEKIPVWLPSAMTIGASDVPASWDITSDSLAAWLAGRIKAEALLLIKQTQAFSAEDSIANLMARNIVDPAFAAMLPEGTGLFLAGPADATGARSALAAGKLPGTKIRPAAGPLRRAG